MGASAWKYFTPFRENLQEALDDLREKEFQAGRFYRPGSNLPENFEEWAKQLNLPEEQWQLFKEGFNE